MRTMLLQQLLLALTILFVSSNEVNPRIQRRYKQNKVLNRLAKPQESRRRYPPENLRIRNEYPIPLHGAEDRSQSRGGNLTTTHDHPYMAAIIINGKLWCAGSIVNPKWVLTAAHCLNYVLHVSPSKSLSRYVKVRVGSPKAHDGGTVIDVVGAIRHPKYELVPVPHADVALVKLADNLQFHKFVNMVPIYEGDTEPFAQSFIQVSGWGATRGTDIMFREQPPNMLTARLKVRPQQYCVDSYQLVEAFQFTEDFFCASLRNGTRDVCLFDAGAPAVQNNHLVGLMSFGPEKCGHNFQPAVFIKAFYFRDFVRQTIAQYKNAEDVEHVVKHVDSEPDVPAVESDYGNANIVLISNEEVEDRM